MRFFLFIILCAICTKGTGQISPCPSCSPPNCWGASVVNNTHCTQYLSFGYGGNPICGYSPGDSFVFSPNQKTIWSRCYKCVDGPCSCPAGIYLVDPLNPTLHLIPWGNFPSITGTPTTYTISTPRCGTYHVTVWISANVIYMTFNP